MKATASMFKYQDLLKNLIARDLKSRYRGSFLGVLWTVLTPLFMALIYIVFLGFLGFEMPMEQLIIGVFAWQFTVQSIQSGMNAITGNSNLVKKIYFPRIIIPLSVNLSALINYLLMLAVQLPLVAFFLGGKNLDLWVSALPVIVAYHFMFNFSIALLAAASNVYFRDTQHFVGLFLSAWFFLSPAMYPISEVTKWVGGNSWLGELYMLNPLALIITAYRTLQIPGEIFPWSAGAIIGWSWPFALFACSLLFFRRSERYFADWL